MWNHWKQRELISIMLVQTCCCQLDRPVRTTNQLDNPLPPFVYGPGSNGASWDLFSTHCHRFCQLCVIIPLPFYKQSLHNVGSFRFREVWHESAWTKPTFRGLQDALIGSHRVDTTDGHTRNTVRTKDTTIGNHVVQGNLYWTVNPAGNQVCH